MLLAFLQYHATTSGLLFSHQSNIWICLIPCQISSPSSSLLSILTDSSTSSEGIFQQMLTRDARFCSYEAFMLLLSHGPSSKMSCFVCISPSLGGKEEVSPCYSIMTKSHCCEITKWRNCRKSSKCWHKFTRKCPDRCWNLGIDDSGKELESNMICSNGNQVEAS